MIVQLLAALPNPLSCFTVWRFTRLVGWLVGRLFVTMPKIPLYDVLDHTNHTFSESYRSKDIYTDIPKCLIHKYTNTNTQIHKYANTAYDKVPERPNMWYIFEKRIVQGYKEFPRAERTNINIQIQIFQFCIRLDLTSSYYHSLKPEFRTVVRCLVHL